MPGTSGGDVGGLADGILMPHSFLLDHVSPATRLLEKRRQMFGIQEALESQKEDFSRRETYKQHAACIHPPYSKSL